MYAYAILHINTGIIHCFYHGQTDCFIFFIIFLNGMTIIFSCVSFFVGAKRVGAGTRPAPTTSGYNQQRPTYGTIVINFERSDNFFNFYNFFNFSNPFFYSLSGCCPSCAAHMHSVTFISEKTAVNDDSSGEHA